MTAPVFDRDAAMRQLDALHPVSDADHLIWSGTLKAARHFAPNAEDRELLLDKAEALTEAGASVYITPGHFRRSGEGKEKRNKSTVSGAVVAWIDCDAWADGQEVTLGALREQFPNALVVVQTREGRRQVFVLLDEETDRDDIKVLNLGLVRLFDGDPAPVNASAFMRLAGSVNFKDDLAAAEPVLLLECGEVRVATEELRSYLAQVAPTPAKTRTTKNGAATGDLTFTELLDLAPELIEGDGRNKHLAALAGHRANLTPRGQRDVYDAQVRSDNRQFAEPLDDDERDAVADSIWETEYPPLASVTSIAPASGDGGWGDFEPLDDVVRPAFPVEHLSRPLREMAIAVTANTSTPPVLAGLLSIGATSSAIQRRVRFVKPWVEATGLYTAVVMEPGERKTPVFAATVASPLGQLQKELREQTADDRLTRAVARETAVELAKKQAAVAKKVSDAEALNRAVTARRVAEEMWVPASPQLVTSDVTPERCENLLMEQDGRITVASDEGGIFSVIAGRYANGIPNIDVFAKGYTGTAPLLVDRQGRKVEVERPTVSMLLAVQPDVLAEVAANRVMRGRGLLDRFIWAVPLPMAGYRPVDTPEIPGDVAVRYYDALRLASVVTKLELELVLDSRASDEFNTFRSEIEERQRDGADLHPIKGWASKLPGQVLRIAAVFHIVDAEGQPSHRVTVSTLRRALAFAPYLEAHALIAFSQSGRIAAVNDAQRLIGWFTDETLSSFKRSEAMKARRLDREAMDA